MKFNLNKEHVSLDFLFILALLCLFSFGSLMAVVMGANTYMKIKDASDSAFELRTPLSYISMKVRQHDEINSVAVVQKEGINTLVLEGLDGEELCQTWIYEYQGNLCEVYLEKDTAFKLEDGMAILPSHGLTLEMLNGILTVEAEDHNGKTQRLTLSLRTFQQGDLS
ncbi:DUF4860 domain-containing protein [Anoxybacterium hadale]|uniref:DUF4860 domain-containing protein n=1 Tax=Anoxybacterium hadale TaxID=3408580 RepID=A0ACD1AAG2_9FIRM|nr:DUF4860 domain-containing protein [Clostridiales bacterium]